MFNGETNLPVSVTIEWNTIFIMRIFVLQALLLGELTLRMETHCISGEECNEEKDDKAFPFGPV